MYKYGIGYHIHGITRPLQIILRQVLKVNYLFWGNEKLVLIGRFKSCKRGYAETVPFNFASGFGIQDSPTNFSLINIGTGFAKVCLPQSRTSQKIWTYTLKCLLNLNIFAQCGIHIFFKCLNEDLIKSMKFSANGHKYLTQKETQNFWYRRLPYLFVYSPSKRTFRGPKLTILQ